MDLIEYLDQYTGICFQDELLVHELFADDLYLLADNTKNSQKQLDGLAKFCKPNQMIANTIKTKIMLYGRSCDQNVQLSMNGNLIEKVEKYKSLGIVFNTVKNINGNIFRYNTDHLNNKARSAIFGT